MKRLFYITALLMLAASCDDQIDGFYGECQIVLRGEIDDQADTRAVVGNPTYIQSGGKTYAWAEDVTSNTDHVAAWAVTANGSGGFTGTSQYFPQSRHSLKMRAICGNFTATPTAWGSFTHWVEADQTAAVSRVSDLLYAVSEPQAPNGLKTTFPLKFQHMMSKVRVAIYPATGEVNDLTGATMRVVGGGGTVVFTPDKTVTPVTLTDPDTRTAMLGTHVTHDVHITPTIVANFDTEPEMYGEAVVVPQTFDGENNLFVMWINDNKTQLTFTPQSFEMQSGMEYTFKIKVYNNMLVVECTITPWGTGSIGQDGYRVSSPLDGDVVLGLGDWNNGNVNKIYRNDPIPKMINVGNWDGVRNVGVFETGSLRKSTKLQGWVRSTTVPDVYGAVPVTAVSLDKSQLSLAVGEKTTLCAKISPLYATDKSVTWGTSDSSVVTITNGFVSAVGAGTATITVSTTDGSKTAACEVTVN